MTATQKIRLALTGSPTGEPHFQHEGPSVVRWITGGTLPDVRATLHHRASEIEVRCAICQDSLGQFPASYDANTPEILAGIRRAYPLNHQH